MSQKPSILIVDDNVSLCDVLTDVLELKGYSVTTAKDGLEAINKVENHPFDMVFMDIKMPHMDGVETYKKIKQLRPGTLAMLMTAYAVEDLIQEALQEGAFGVIYKPLDIDKVTAIIEEAQSTKAGALILVVDKDPQTGRMLMGKLVSRNYRIGIASTGEEAIGMAREKAYDIIFIEIILPTLNGMETYLSLKKLHPEIVAIMMTSDPQETTDLVQQAINEGAYTCLNKPLDMDKLVGLVNDIIKAKKHK